MVALALLVLVAHLVPLAMLVRMDPEAPVVIPDLLAVLVSKAWLVLLVWLVKKAHLANLVLPVPLVSQVLVVFSVPLVLLVCLAQEEIVVSLVVQVAPVSPVK